MTVVFAQEAQEALVVLAGHVEQGDHEAIVTVGLLEPDLDDAPQSLRVRSRDMNSG